MDDQQTVRVARWIEEISDDLGLSAPVDVDTILDVAKVAAHSVERPAAPVSTYLLGLAVAQGADARAAADAIARRAREFDG